MPGSLEPLDLTVQIPYHFRCPISLELMRDPVTVSTGQTYDRSSIESWVATGNTTCPVTRAPLTDFTLIPNHTLRRLIQDWCVANRAFGVERIPTPKQPAEPSLVRSLLNQAASASNPTHSRLSALRRLRGLARDSDKNRSVISSHNVREVLVNLVFSSSQSSDLSHESLAILVMFPLTEFDCVGISSEPERIGYLANLLFHSSIEVRVNSAALIENVIAGTRSPDLRLQISNTEIIFQGVIEILKNPLSSPRALKVGIKALFALCLVKQTRHKAVTAGAAETLIDRLADFDKCDAERALATIELLCRIQVGCAAFAAHALTVPLLVKTILKISDRATEYAAGALLALCSASELSQKEAVCAGILTQLLLLVQSDCTDRAKRKAQMLLKLLRDAWPEDSVGNSDDFLCSDVVPF
ncbi:PREDICTED: U-box domain-containing protein 26-like isoform X2 [Populus euphratica]|uniref:U-box domain-containing protein n=1 Tax=Populus euphratica TaxID=75702 RepID=A0AAJ6SXD2_POPEU|nr:PREDICTED: U-box domain-containing protein 26-like isoform X1 [Populus euphratica]XP_011000695.1 PREDICTED: U-box domain-containing protein 26-like isoform X2 [Populus euphratica]